MSAGARARQLRTKRTQSASGRARERGVRECASVCSWTLVACAAAASAFDAARSRFSVKTDPARGPSAAAEGEGTEG
eukprot:2427412-Pleurochrysis_carterae.AAC.1